MIAESPQIARSAVIHAFAEAARAHFHDRLVAIYVLPHDPYEEQPPTPEEQAQLLHFGLVLTSVERDAKHAYEIADLVSNVEARFHHTYAITVAVAGLNEIKGSTRPASMEEGVLL